MLLEPIDCFIVVTLPYPTPPTLPTDLPFHPILLYSYWPENSTQLKGHLKMPAIQPAAG